MCFIGAIGCFFGPRVVGLVLLFLTFLFWFWILVSDRTLHGRPNRWPIVGRACLVCAVVLSVIGYAGVRWGPGARAEVTRSGNRKAVSPKSALPPQSDRPREQEGAAELPAAELKEPQRSASQGVPNPSQGTKSRGAAAKSVPRDSGGRGNPPDQQPQLPPQPQPEQPVPAARELIATFVYATSNFPDAPHAAELTIQTSVIMQPTSLLVSCDNEIARAEYHLAGVAVTMGHYEHYTRDRHGYLVDLRETPFRPETPLIITLSSKAKITPAWVALYSLADDKINLVSPKCPVLRSGSKDGPL